MNINNQSETNSQPRRLFAWILLSGLLILRLPIFTGILLFTRPRWLESSFYIGTYFLTACLIYIERKQLNDFHIDKFALAIIVVSGPLMTIIRSLVSPNIDPLSFPNLPSLLCWIISIGLCISFWINHIPIFSITRKSVTYLGIGIITALLIALFLGFLTSIDYPNCIYELRNGLPFEIQLVIPSLFIQLGLAAVAEEPLFRGFLWGYLQKAGWKNIWICIFQTIFFMIGHLTYIQKAPVTFWIVVPISGIFFGILVWKTKTISSSLAAHATLNAVIHPISCVINSI